MTDKSASQLARLGALLNKPTITPDELFRSGVLPLSRNAIYEAIKRGEIEVLSFGRKKAIVTAALRKRLGLDPIRTDGAEAA
jgi:hypothetical protein